jgi:hypothetical protein
MNDKSWRDSETFIVGRALTSDPWQNGLSDWDTLAQLKASFSTHCPIDKGWIERCHAYGIRCFPYVVFYMGSPRQASTALLPTLTRESAGPIIPIGTSATHHARPDSGSLAPLPAMALG